MAWSNSTCIRIVTWVLKVTIVIGLELEPCSVYCVVATVLSIGKVHESYVPLSMYKVKTTVWWTLEIEDKVSILHKCLNVDSWVSQPCGALDTTMSYALYKWSGLLALGEELGTWYEEKSSSLNTETPHVRYLKSRG